MKNFLTGFVVWVVFMLIMFVIGHILYSFIEWDYSKLYWDLGEWGRGTRIIIVFISFTCFMITVGMIMKDEDETNNNS